MFEICVIYKPNQVLNNKYLIIISYMLVYYMLVYNLWYLDSYDYWLIYMK